MSGDVRVGISGWTYEPWRGSFYPDDLPRKQELAYAARQFDTIEINGTFYSLQTPESFRNWYQTAPAGFRYAVKGSRYITHMKRLREPEQALANFFASGLLELKEKLGPILWQLPPRMAYDQERVDAFLKRLPRDFEAAAALGRRHDQRVSGRTSMKVDHNRRIRHALEPRHESFFAPAVIDLLRRQSVALVISDSPGAWPTSHDITAGFIYVRMHGDAELYASGYDRKTLDRWAERIAAWRRGEVPADARTVSDEPPPSRKSRDVYVYFDNDAKAHAPPNALDLADKLRRRGQ